MVNALKANDGGEDKEEAGTSSDSPKRLIRLWIYSHHIYSMQKRKLILEWCRELALTGFSMPGKPGIVCAEGLDHSKEKDGRKFADFEEISFDVKQGQGRNYHMDMGKFLDFLKSHDCESIFKLYFGV